MAVDLANSPTESTNEVRSRILDQAPAQPRDQQRQSPFFTKPQDEGLGAAGGDPMIQMMQSAKMVDMAFQRIAQLAPDAVTALAGIQMEFKQIMAGIIQGATAQAAPPIMPPMGMQSAAPTAGQQMSPGL